jgi:hypothetical protein
MFQVTQESTFFYSAGKVDSVQVTFSPLRPGDFTTWLLMGSNDAVEPHYLIPVKGSGVTPTIATDDVIEFGYVLVDSSKTIDVSIRNVGRAPLHISSWMPGGTDASLFSFTNPGTVIIAGGDSLVLPVTFSPKSYGEKNALIVIASDDLVNSSYDLRLHGNATTLDVEDVPLAAEVTLGQNYPNPVSLSENGHTVYAVTLPSPMAVTLGLYDLQGREVLRVAEGMFTAGRHDLTARLTGLPSGGYQALLTARIGGRQLRRQVMTIIVR